MWIFLGRTLFPVEIMCEKPPVVEYTVQVWDGNSTPGSSVGYYCKAGFYDNGGQNISICKENGQWTTPSLLCRGNDKVSKG